MACGLLAAIRARRYKHIRYLLDSGLSVNSRDAAGKTAIVTALHIQEPRHRFSIFKMLAKRGADLACMDPTTEKTPFLWACSLPGRTKEALFILSETEADVDLSLKDITGKTALHYAILNGDTKLTSAICHLLAKFGLSADFVRDSQGFTPYLYARKLGQGECAKILVEVGGASNCHLDLSAYQMPDHWESVGQFHREKKKRRDSRSKMNTYKLLGRLPQLKVANFNVDKLSVVHSKYDHNLLEKTPKSSINFDKLSRENTELPDISTKIDCGRRLSGPEALLEPEQSQHASIPNITITRAEDHVAETAASVSHPLILPPIAETSMLLAPPSTPPISRQSPPKLKKVQKFYISPPILDRVEKVVRLKKAARSRGETLRQQQQISDLLQLCADKNRHNYIQRPFGLPPIKQHQDKKISANKSDKSSRSKRESDRLDFQDRFTRAGVSARKTRTMLVTKDTAQSRSVSQVM